MFVIEVSPVQFAAGAGHLLTGFTCRFAETCGVRSSLRNARLVAQEPSPMAGAAEGV
jgi:hypothetical protein